MAGERLIVGLGNPGARYEYTRHNLGFLVAECLARRFQWPFQKSTCCRGVLAEGRVNDVPVMILMPGTFMNLSGQAVRPLAERYGIPGESILVVCDDLTIDFGLLRLRRRGSDGGHNGLKSVIEALGTQEFPRLRMGLGRAGADPVEFVLGEFAERERQGLEDFVAQAADCCAAWVSQDMESVMSQFNKRKGNE